MTYLSFGLAVRAWQAWPHYPTLRCEHGNVYCVETYVKDIEVTLYHDECGCQRTLEAGSEEGHWIYQNVIHDRDLVQYIMNFDSILAMRRTY